MDSNPTTIHADGISVRSDNGTIEEGEEKGLMEEEEFVKEFLGRHNELRKLHGSPELALSEELCAMAREWSNKIAWKGHVSFAEISGIGENVTVFPFEKSAKEMVDYWYEENRKYEYDAPGWQAGTNYFSQIIWRSTKEIGVSRTVMRRSSQKLLKKEMNKIEKKETIKRQKNVVVVAFYRPAGNSNRSGQFMLNVSKPII